MRNVHVLTYVLTYVLTDVLTNVAADQRIVITYQ